MDLPDNAPYGVAWAPFLRGFPYGDRYVLARTEPDPTAARSGIVVSRACILPLETFAQVTDIRPVTRVLETAWDNLPSDDGSQILIDNDVLPDATADLEATAGALLTHGKGPVVRLGQDGFDDLVVALWARLEPGLRRGFAFRLSFGPRDIVETAPPALVCVPKALEGQWHGHRVVRASGPGSSTSLATAVLCGHPSGSALATFMRDTGIEPNAFTHLIMAEHAYRLMTAEPCLTSMIETVRLLSKLAPDPSSGRAHKDALIGSLCEFLARANASELLPLRNVTLAAMPSPDRVWSAVQGWMAGNGFPDDQVTEMLGVVQSAVTADLAVAEWRTAILGGLKAAARNAGADFPKAFWRWSTLSADTAVAALEAVGVVGGLEQRLAKSIPENLPRNAADAVAAMAAKHGWLVLHGASLSVAHTPSDAVRLQLALDKDPGFFDGLKAALGRAKPPDIFSCALQSADPRLPLLAGAEVAKRPSLLRSADMASNRALSVWREALAVTTDAWNGPTNPQAAFHSVLDAWANGSAADTGLLDLLSQTPLGDLAAYSRRSEIWPRVGTPVRERLLKATANGWLAGASADGHPPFEPDESLRAIILADAGLDDALLALTPGQVTTAMRVIASLPDYGERRFRNLLRQILAKASAIAEIEAEGIGRLVASGRWRDTARDLFLAFRAGRNDLKPSLQACHGLFNFWDGLELWRLGVGAISDDAKWNAFQTLAAEVYSAGPDQDSLWERAGGSNAELPASGTGMSRWSAALRGVRHGAGVRASDLLNTMLDDYPRNERLRHLAEDPLFK